MHRNENRPVYALRSVLSSAMTKPSCIPACFSDFCPQEGQQQNLCGFSMWNYFSNAAAHIRLCMGHGPETLLVVLILLRAEFSNLFQRQCSNSADMSRQCRARHLRVAVGIACGIISTSLEFHISLWKVFLVWQTLHFFFSIF